MLLATILGKERLDSNFNIVKKGTRRLNMCLTLFFKYCLKKSHGGHTSALGWMTSLIYMGAFAKCAANL